MDPLESFGELKKICQTTAHKDVTNVYMRFVSRNISIFITRFLIPTPVTADQVSFAMIVMGILASLFFLSSSQAMFVLGALGLQLWYLLDCVDGEIARYRLYQKTGKLVEEKVELPMTGAYWDYLNHYIVHGLAPLTAGFGLFLAYENLAWFLLGFLASISQVMLLAVHDTKSRAFIAKVKKAGQSHWVGLNPKPNKGETQKKKWGLAKWIFVALHYSTTYPTVMNAALLAGIFDLRGFFLVYYALVSPIVFIGLAAKNLRNQGLDREFESEFFLVKRHSKEFVETF